MNRIPESLSALFWEYEPDTLSLEHDRDLIIGRVLSSAGWDGVKWLRSEFTESDLRDWILRSKGRNLSPPRLRFWELILDLPHFQVSEWLSETCRRIWDGRATS